MAVTPLTAGPVPAQPGSAGNARGRLARIREIEATSGPAAAEQAIVALLREGAPSPQAFLALGRILIKQGKMEDAIRAAARAKALAPLEVDPLVMIGVVNLRMGRPAVAAEAFADALRLDPGAVRAQLGAAAVKLAAGELDDALALCERVLAADPTLERAHELRAQVNVRLGRTEPAMADLRGIIRANPANRRALRAFVSLMRRESREEEALAFFREDAAAHPGDRQRAARLARVAALAGKPEIAVEQFRQLEAQGGAGQADRVRFIATLIQAGDLDRARQMIGTLGGQRVLRPVSIKLLGDVALKAGDPTEAIRQYQAACRAAQAEGLDPASEARGASPEERARLWRAHAQRSLVAAYRERRAQADA